MPRSVHITAETIAMVLAGRVALGAYQAGAYAAMEDRLRRRVNWLAGASIGAVNAALVTGNPPNRRLEALKSFWSLCGFGRLNSGETRISILTTDLLTGEPVVFDTAAGDVIGVDHILASCGFVPEHTAEIVEEGIVDGAVSRQRMSFVLSVKVATARRHIVALDQRGMLVPSGEGRGRRLGDIPALAHFRLEALRQLHMGGALCERRPDLAIAKLMPFEAYARFIRETTGQKISGLQRELPRLPTLLFGSGSSTGFGVTSIAGAPDEPPTR